MLRTALDIFDEYEGRYEKNTTIKKITNIVNIVNI